MTAAGYDYIVVGSGSAGAAIAGRLSEDPAVSVLLLEAGPRDRHPFQLMPLAFLKVALSPSVTWQYMTEPEPGLNGRTLILPRGRTLGGSSSINAMIAIRGNRRDYDRWSEEGLAGWSYDEVLPYFKRLENSWRGAGPYHGAGGPVDISAVEGPDMLYAPLVEAAAAAGVPFCEDPNGAGQEGISRMEGTTGNGRRSSTARAYLYPAMSRPNLTIRTGALTSRVIVEHARAVGVEFAIGGALQQARADREVIVSGGSYNSPQLLLLSGIGPADELRAIGVAPVHDLPGVGRNLSDHPNILNTYELNGTEGMTRHLRFDRAALAVGQWFATRRGPFASTGASANVFLRTRDGLDRPDAQMITMPISNTADLWMPKITRAPSYCMTARIGPLHPQSRGWVKLRSTDPRDHPRIFINMFAEPEDLATTIRAVKLSREIHSQPPLRDMIRQELLPGGEGLSDAELGEIIRNTAAHRAHPVGTCRMGHDGDAVVDAELKVHGIDGLRVADASIMPELPSGNTNLPSIMIGEKAADLIRGRAPAHVDG